ncbi:sensor histidine kinase [Alteromonas facilis]|uniref:sensor histidine kinase n=1 Tax=Alteromonas facilis TaxID=2048004 RepID=UPI000C29557A|nr:HAMP domain-containing sensor histidine kinase [Alteromonas facilis]
MQLGSLRQLTLVSFAVALIPLIALLIQSQKDLADVARMTAEDNGFFVNLVSGTRNLESNAVDIERLFRQYQIVQNETTVTLIHTRLNAFSIDAQSICSLLYQYSCDALISQIDQLHAYTTDASSEGLSEQLSNFTRSVASLREAVSIAINNRISEQQTTMQTLRQGQAWSTSILVLLSLGLVIVGSHMIVHPFKKLKSVIKAIAQQSDGLPSISQKGPKELIEIEKDLHWLAERLQQLEHLRTALLRHASHELKTPLASIKEGCSLLNEQLVGELTPPQQEVVGLLASSTERLNLLVEGLLNYNLLLQQAKPQVALTDVHDLLQKCLTENALALKQNGHHIETDIRVAHMYTDPSLFRRILDNLLSNAIAYGVSQKPIFIRIFEEGDYNVLEVANDGNAIVPEERKALFEPFIRGGATRNDKVIGAGLGLSIVNDCARLLHGRVDIVDVDYADVCFRIRLPANVAM